MIRHTRILASQQRSARQDLSALFLRMVNEVRMVLLRYADGNGVIPISQMQVVRTNVGRVVAPYFVGADNRNAYADDGTPLSPFARLLSRHMVRVSYGVVIAHQQYIERVSPPDVMLWLSQAEEPVAEMQDRRAMVQHEPLHEWLDSRGYRLSDRIWRTGEETRRKLDLLIADGIRKGNNASSIARLAEQFLLPGREKIRTNTPYGRDGSYDAMRLMRSEITLAHSRAALMAASANPYVVSMNYDLSPSHPKPDICDKFAAGSPYPVSECPTPVLSTHPHCLCVLSPNVGDVDAIIADLRQQIGRDERALVNPSDPPRFLRWLFGAVVVNSVLNELQGI